MTVFMHSLLWATSLNFLLILMVYFLEDCSIIFSPFLTFIIDFVYCLTASDKRWQQYGRRDILVLVLILMFVEHWPFHDIVLVSDIYFFPLHIAFVSDIYNNKSLLLLGMTIFMPILHEKIEAQKGKVTCLSHS